MSYEDEIEENEESENEFIFDAEGYTAKCMNILIESVLNPENLHEIGIAATRDLKYRYEKEGYIPDGEQQSGDHCLLVSSKIARQIGG
jgi:hypothetical protein